MVGRQRKPLIVLLLMLVTLGIYGLYWIYISFAEVRAYRGKGTSGIVGLLLALIPVSIFLLPSHVGDMYAEAGKTKPVTGMTGLCEPGSTNGRRLWGRASARGGATRRRARLAGPVTQPDS